jgi:hypothetical protein
MDLKNWHYYFFYASPRIATIDGRYLTLVFELKGKGMARVITGWDMDDAEKRYYLKNRKG